MIINKDFKEFIKLLNDNFVRYLIVGGYAVAFHGHPHYTKDLDIWIYPDKENAKKLIEAMKEFGFNSLDLKIEDFVKPGYVIQLGYLPNRIDILTDITGVEFDICYSEKIKVEIDGTRVNFIDLENLKKNKTATGRYQDLADLEHLE
ncbi:MAG: nucleotidyltransferase [Candidatus Cloacimonetes bacterium]|nr:nucleotidyltransferase [Candidatus Cloacimonadota bacterium]